MAGEPPVIHIPDSKPVGGGLPTGASPGGLDQSTPASEPRSLTLSGDNIGNYRITAEDVPGVKEEPRPAKVPEGDRGTDDGGVQGRVDEDILQKPRPEQRPDKTGTRDRDVIKESVGRDTGNISGFQRSDYTIKPGELKREGSWKDAAKNN